MASRSVNMYLGLFPSDMIVSTKNVYSYKTPASFGSIPSSVNMNDVSFSKLNMEMWRLVKILNLAINRQLIYFQTILMIHNNFLKKIINDGFF